MMNSFLLLFFSFMAVLFGLVSKRPPQLQGYIPDGPQDGASDDITCGHT